MMFFPKLLLEEHTSQSRSGVLGLGRFSLGSGCCCCLRGKEVDYLHFSRVRVTLPKIPSHPKRAVKIIVLF